MDMMLSVMRNRNRFFEVSQETGNFVIENGVIDLCNKYLIDQYILITGSILNNGVYLLKDDLYTLDGARDEEFTGTVYGLAVPPDFIQLVKDIETFESSDEATRTNLIKESFGGISYTLSTDENGQIAGWETVFAKRLASFKPITVFTRIKV